MVTVHFHVLDLNDKFDRGAGASGPQLLDILETMSAAFFCALQLG